MYNVLIDRILNVMWGVATLSGLASTRVKTSFGGFLNNILFRESALAVYSIYLLTYDYLVWEVGMISLLEFLAIFHIF